MWKNHSCDGARPVLGNMNLNNGLGKTEQAHTAARDEAHRESSDDMDDLAKAALCGWRA